jgi:hypothetical protein
MVRLRADLWCAAFARRHNDLGNMCVISRKGDAAAGQIWVEVDHLDGSVSLFTPAPAMHAGQDRDGRIFEKRFDRVPPQEVRDRISREVKFDPDLWVISVELRGADYGLELTEGS